LALILVTAVLALGASGLSRLWRGHRGRLAVAAAPVILAGGFNLWWMRERPITDLLVPGHNPNPVGYAFEQLPLWFFQSIAAFPLRDQPAPPLVYVAYGLLLVGFCTAGTIAAGRRQRMVVAFALCASMAVPVLFTANMYGRYGSIWQGRYGLPMSVGVLMLCAVALEESPLAGRQTAGRRTHLVVAVGWILIAFAHLVSVVNVLGDEAATSPLAHDPQWVAHPGWAVSGLVLLACFAWFWGVHGDQAPLSGHRVRAFVTGRRPIATEPSSARTGPWT
jgi:hypothetical protein